MVAVSLEKLAAQRDEALEPTTPEAPRVVDSQDETIGRGDLITQLVHS